MMYLLFRHHGVMPNTFYKMGYGEKTIAKAFMEYEMQQKKEEMEEIQKEMEV